MEAEFPPLMPTPTLTVPMTSMAMALASIAGGHLLQHSLFKGIEALLHISLHRDEDLDSAGL